MILKARQLASFIAKHEADHRGWCGVDEEGCIEPIDMIDGVVEVSGRVSVREEGRHGPVGLDYNPTGSTGVQWDTAVTVGVRCGACHESAYVDDWLLQVEPFKELVDDVADRLSGIFGS